MGGLSLRAVTIAAQIGRDDREMVHHPGGHTVPHHVCLGMPVKKKGRTVASVRTRSVASPVSIIPSSNSSNIGASLAGLRNERPPDGAMN